MVEKLNIIVCLALLFCLLPVAVIARKLRHKLAIGPLVAVIVIQVMSPALVWIPEQAWPSLAFNATILYVILHWRKKLWHMVVAEFNPDRTPLTRRSDRVLA